MARPRAVAAKEKVADGNRVRVTEVLSSNVVLAGDLRIRLPVNRVSEIKVGDEIEIYIENNLARLKTA